MKRYKTSEILFRKIDSSFAEKAFNGSFHVRSSSGDLDHPQWIRGAGVNGDGIIDIFDLVVVALHLGEAS